MSVLSRRSSFWTAAAVAGVTLWASAASSTNYPLYAAQWHLDAWVPTAIFATYPIVLIPMLLVFGNLSDYIGRRKAILLGLGAVSAGALLLGVAPDLALVFAGRALLGVGVGLALSPSTAAIIEFSAPGKARQSGSTTAAATATGLALATLVGGALVQYGPEPLYLDHWVLLIVALAVFALAFFLPRHTPDVAAGHWRPRKLLIPRQSRTRFLGGVFAIAGAYSLGAIYVGLGAQISRTLVDSDNAFIGGAVIAVSAVTIGIVAVLARPVPPLTAVVIGPVLVLLGLLVLVAAGWAHSLPLFIASSIVGGGGYSFLFAGGLGLVSSGLPAHHRAAALSTAYTAAYLAQAATALWLGAVATSSGFELAVQIGAVIVVGLSVTGLVLALAGRRTAGPAPASPVAE